ncbi:uncharacterized protein K460DRAFT_291217, partial [Cucurbitaria berberidis CBS 394.84]
LGYRVLYLQVGFERRRFAAHEDLLCSRSQFFKERFQKGRKDIEGECVICHENLSDLETDLTFCSDCGKNIHNKCIRKWKQNQNTCPMCRTTWSNKKITKHEVFREIESELFEVYVQWLYQQSIPKYMEAKDDGPEIHCYRLLEAHMLGETLQDTDFQQAIRQEIIEFCLANPKCIDTDVIELVFHDNIAEDHILRKLILELYALLGDPDWLVNTEEVPHRFIVDLAQAYVRKSKILLSAGGDVRKVLAEAGYIEQDDASLEDGDGVVG